MAICCLGYKEERPRASELRLGLSKATLSGQGGGQAPLGPPDPALPPVHLRTPPARPPLTQHRGASVFHPRTGAVSSEVSETFSSCPRAGRAPVRPREE